MLDTTVSTAISTLRSLVQLALSRAASAFNLAAAGQTAATVAIANVVITTTAGALTVPTTMNGVVLVAGNQFLLANQTTAAECGLYKVLSVSNTTATVARVASMGVGDSIVPGTTINVAAGPTLLPNSTWKATATTGVYGTNDPLFYPKTVKASITLAAGTYALGAAEGLFFLTGATAATMRTAAGGTTTLTLEYVRLGTQTPGKSGTGVMTIEAAVAAGTINAADNSVLDVTVTNW